MRRFIIHARKAWLKGLSPKENREIPPLNYALVREMKAAFPDLHISVNGGINDLSEARAHLEAGLDGVMIGRAAYHRPADILLSADREIFGEDTPIARAEAIATEQEMKAKVAENRSHLVLAESEVPMAMATALREGNIFGSGNGAHGAQ